MWKYEMIQDCLNTINRLNKELLERVKFEKELINEINLLRKIKDLTNEKK